MSLRKEYFLKNGMPCNEDGLFYEEYVEWLETKLQNTSSNSDYAKLPKVKDPELSRCIKNIQVAIEKLGNFA